MLMAFSATMTSFVVGLTCLMCHAANETVTFALPIPASSGTRTGPWKTAIQQRCLSVYFAMRALPPGSFGGNSISTTGWTLSGMPKL